MSPPVRAAYAAETARLNQVASGVGDQVNWAATHPSDAAAWTLGSINAQAEGVAKIVPGTIDLLADLDEGKFFKVVGDYVTNLPSRYNKGSAEYAKRIASGDYYGAGKVATETVLPEAAPVAGAIVGGMRGGRASVVEGAEPKPPTGVIGEKPASVTGRPDVDPVPTTTEPALPPPKSGVYEVRGTLDGKKKKYVGSAEDMEARLKQKKHPTRQLQDTGQGVTVTTKPVDVSDAATLAERQRILRTNEQVSMDEMREEPGESLNRMRARALEKFEVDLKRYGDRRQAPQTKQVEPKADDKR